MGRRESARERVLALLWLAGGALTALTLVLPYRDMVVDEGVRLVVAPVAVAIGLALLMVPPLADRWLHLVLALGLVAITTCTASGLPELEGIFYLLPVVFTAAQFEQRVAFVYLVACAGAYALALGIGATLTQVEPIVPWVLVMGVGALLFAALQAGRRDRRIAEALQATLLPPSLPALADMALAARYVPAAREADVGGDLYDAFVLGDGRLALVVGDVEGKGLRAAAEVGPIRTAARAHLVEGASPADALDRVEHVLDEDAPTATLLIAVVDEEAATWASAGHLPPLLVPARGAPTLLEGAPRPPLGVHDDRSAVEAHAPLGAGDALVLFTDGLVERRDHGLDAGIERLRTALREAGNVDALLAAALSVAPARAADDYAVLVAQRR